jgi:glycine dehydrogenase subunit 1
MAIAATVYLAWLGPAGLEELGRQCAAKAAYAFERLTEVPGAEPMFEGAPFFKEFTLRLPTDAGPVLDALTGLGFLGGVAMPDVDARAIAVAVTERRTRAEIDALAEALAEVLA